MQRFAIRRNCVGGGPGVESLVKSHKLFFSAENGFVATSALHYFNLKKQD